MLRLTHHIFSNQPRPLLGRVLFNQEIPKSVIGSSVERSKTRPPVPREAVKPPESTRTILKPQEAQDTTDRVSKTLQEIKNLPDPTPQPMTEREWKNEWDTQEQALDFALASIGLQKQQYIDALKRVESHQQRGFFKKLIDRFGSNQTQLDNSQNIVNRVNALVSNSVAIDHYNSEYVKEQDSIQANKIALIDGQLQTGLLTAEAAAAQKQAILNPKQVDRRDEIAPLPKITPPVDRLHEITITPAERNAYKRNQPTDSDDAQYVRRTMQSINPPKTKTKLGFVGAAALSLGAAIGGWLSKKEAPTEDIPNQPTVSQKASVQPEFVGPEAPAVSDMDFTKTPRRIESKLQPNAFRLGQTIPRVNGLTVERTIPLGQHFEGDTTSFTSTVASKIENGVKLEVTTITDANGNGKEQVWRYKDPNAPITESLRTIVAKSNGDELVVTGIATFDSTGKASIQGDIKSTVSRREAGVYGKEVKPISNSKLNDLRALDALENLSPRQDAPIAKE